MATTASGSVLLLLLLAAGASVDGRVISNRTSSTGLVSDGVHDHRDGSPYLLLRSFSAVSASDSCDQTYGFMPCTTTTVGNLFLILVYGYLMFLAATYLSSGSELLLELLGPGLVGGLLLPILGALPDAMLILVSGLSGSTETAQSQVSVGMGLLAGSTVMLLTIIWGTCVIVGKCDLQDSVAKDSQDTKGFSLTGSGVSTDIWTSYAAIIMVISVIPFIIVQLPQVLHSTSARRLAVLIALIVSLILLITYCLYQLKHVMSGLLKHLRMHALGKLLTEEGEPNEEIIRKLFHTVDENQDRKLSKSELRALIVGIRFEEIDLDKNEAVDNVMRDFDTSNDQFIDEEEFLRGISRWLMEAKRYGAYGPDAGPDSSKILDHFHRVNAVDNFSDATGIPTFFISFIALPLATNSSEAVSAIIFASKKKRTTSLTFSELYGAVTMNNVLCLSVFLALVYVRGLTWDFSSEVLVIVIVCVVMGVFASFRTTFPLWTSFVALLLYPFSLALVYVLDYVLGWS
ncbi:hypothetical protein AAG906_026928 [Vitis piasezkii]